MKHLNPIRYIHSSVKIVLKHSRSHAKWINLFGLIFVTVGALILAINTGKTLKVNTILMDHIQKAYGFVDMAPMLDADKNNFLKVVNSARIWNFMGYLFFVLVFILQLLYTTLNLKKSNRSK
jgi:hypothetical protein